MEEITNNIKEIIFDNMKENFVLFNEALAYYGISTLPGGKYRQGGYELSKNKVMEIVEYYKNVIKDEN